MKKYFIVYLCISFLLLNCSVLSFAVNDKQSENLPQTGALRNPLLPEGYDLCEYLLNKGDVNEDGRITASDARIVLRASAGLDVLTEHQKVMADVIIDEQITAGDARTILLLSASIDTYVSRVRVQVPKGEFITLGPLTGNSEYCWYIRNIVDLSTSLIDENRKNVSDNEFEQTFKILTSDFFYGTLIYGSIDGNTVIREYEFEIDCE